MAEQGGGSPEQQQAQEKLQSLFQQIGPLMERVQTAEDPKEKLKAIKAVLDLLAQIKALVGEEVFYSSEQFAQLVDLENQMNQALGQLEG